MVPEDVAKIAFKTHSGHYEYSVMPFGLINALSSFQGLMDHIFQAHLRKFILVLFDDILIYSRSLEEHLQHLKISFDLLVQHQLLTKKSKCVFGAERVEYLGHYISSQGVSTDPRKVEALKTWPEPKTITQLRRFLGLAGYYMRFIKGYGVIDKLKLALTTTPVLALPNFSLTFVVETDACNIGIGVVLMQQG